MKNKNLEFIKNVLVSTPPYWAGGVAGAEISDLFSDSEALITASSTLAEIVLGDGILLFLHARNNKETYYTNNKWDLKNIIYDGITKLAPSLALAEVSYSVSRSGIMYYLLNKDYSSGGSAILADVISLPVYVIGAYVGAKYTGLIKKK